jgi:hypothetical protein
MNRSKLILKIYRLLPERLLKNRVIEGYMQCRAEKELAKVKRDYVKANWEMAELEQKKQELQAKSH